MSLNVLVNRCALTLMFLLRNTRLDYKASYAITSLLKKLTAKTHYTRLEYLTSSAFKALFSRVSTYDKKAHQFPPKSANDWVNINAFEFSCW